MDWEGHQSFETDGLGFRWQARLRLARLAWVDAEDRLDVEEDTVVRDCLASFRSGPPEGLR